MDRDKENYAGRLIRILKAGDSKNWLEHLKNPEFKDFNMTFVNLGIKQFHYSYISETGERIENVVLWNREAKIISPFKKLIRFILKKINYVLQTKKADTYL